MVPHTTRILFPDDFPDRWLTEAVVRLSSSPRLARPLGHG